MINSHMNYTYNHEIVRHVYNSVLLPIVLKSAKTEMILFNLDMHHICASGGSACSSGAQQGSHVINALNKGSEMVTVRFSFSKHNTTAEIDQVVAALLTMLH